MSNVRASERIAFAYFFYLGTAASLRPIPRARRLLAIVGSLTALTAVWVVARRVPILIRDCAPGAYVVAGYYLSGLLFTAPNRSIEGWLMSWDRRVLGDPSRRFASWPRPVVGLLEIVYMGCFLLIAGGFVALMYSGHESLVDRYWTIVLTAELGSFAPLAFVQTRPPWALERKPQLADRTIHDIASTFTERLTIRANTFPSGHVAGSLAVALAVIPVMPLAGTMLLALAVAVALATVVGRYHFVVDVFAGALLAVAALASARWWGV